MQPHQLVVIASATTHKNQTRIARMVFRILAPLKRCVSYVPTGNTRNELTRIATEITSQQNDASQPLYVPNHHSSPNATELTPQHSPTRNTEIKLALQRFSNRKPRRSSHSIHTHPTLEHSSTIRATCSSHKSQARATPCIINF